MSGETNLNFLLKNMRPELNDSRYVLCSIEANLATKFPFSPLLAFQEKEGLTVIVTLEQALEYDLSFDAAWAWIELEVHSSLSAVGFIAAISSKLAQAGISLNVVSAYYHDHLFVPWESREDAMQQLQELSAAASIQSLSSKPE